MRASLSTHLARKFGRLLPAKPLPVKWKGGVVSFTFDDFPKTALAIGGEILERHGVRGTYYTALDLANTTGSLGPMFDNRDVRAAHKRGHEIACHTFRHLDCGRTDVDTLLKDIADNDAGLRALTGGSVPVNFAFPFGGISISAKRALAHRFQSCRGIGCGVNAGTADFADLRANHVYDADDGDESFRQLIDRGRASDGWTIFYTHDVAPRPSPFGCTPARLEAVVAYAAATGAVLPVRDVVAGLARPNPALS